MWACLANKHRVFPVLSLRRLFPISGQRALWISISEIRQENWSLTVLDFYRIAKICWWAGKKIFNENIFQRNLCIGWQEAQSKGPFQFSSGKKSFRIEHATSSPLRGYIVSSHYLILRAAINKASNVFKARNFSLLSKTHKIFTNLPRPASARKEWVLFRIYIYLLFILFIWVHILASTGAL